MREMVFATNNQHKLNEIQKITAGRLRISGLADIGCHQEIEETGNTLEENALIKARFVRERYGYDCFADDTGLEVEALEGAPGVYSSRYAGNGCNPVDNMDKLLTALQGNKNRAAQFRTVIALVINGKEHFFDGIIRGRIIEEKRGSGGFGYDPVFMPDGYDQTFAELGHEVKNSISHRALAMEKLVDFLYSYNLK
ncbi:non-canonical purine NTP diphosphatase [uncultured Proteiniphilum sp.]|uniref:non-canonical purine NTP diphosphatase n=1 Tax=uncultured Proteiniphilum sp. TaxID=497637 RepID=UPI00263A3492|nr:non-canonical purine NTP diphosphatase [uncultured Proteiniphilum sp.]